MKIYLKKNMLINALVIDSILFYPLKLICMRLQAGRITCIGHDQSGDIGSILKVMYHIYCRL